MTLPTSLLSSPLQQAKQLASTLKEHKKLKANFAKTLNTTEKVIQKCAEELIIIGKANGGEVTAANVVAYATNPETTLHPFFNWESSEEERQYIAAALINNITYLFGPDNTIYKLEKISEE